MVVVVVACVVVVVVVLAAFVVGIRKIHMRVYRFKAPDAADL